MWGVVVLVSAVVGTLCFLIACIWLVRLFLIAPTGYQDDTGFHLGDPSPGADSYPKGLRDRSRIARRFGMPDPMSTRPDQDGSARGATNGRNRTKA
jgi:hypothetical protein